MKAIQTTNLPLNETGLHTTLSMEFWRRTLSEGMPFRGRIGRTSDTDIQLVLRGLSGAVETFTRNEHHYIGARIYFADAEVFVNYSIHSREFDCFVAAKTLERLTELEEKLKALLPPSAPPPDKYIWVDFWTLGPQGPVRRRRKITAPLWADIEENYSSETRTQLERLLRLDSIGEAGQLILLYGPAGSGKTYIVRALGRAWKNWCNLHVVVDPDRFFGDEAEYMLHVLLDGTDSEPKDIEERGEPHRWNLFICEDSDEYLTIDAKQRSRAGFSRLLNLVDGLIGQGLRVASLFTTNEEIDRLHPAIIRPGRCLAKIQFSGLDEEEAAAWLDRRGVVYDESDLQPRTMLADLYATTRERPIRTGEERKTVGFGAR